MPAIIVIAAVRRARHRAAAHPQPGGAQPAAAVRRVSARHVHRATAQDGAVRRAALDAGAGVGGRGYHRGAERWLLWQTFTSR